MYVSGYFLHDGQNPAFCALDNSATTTPNTTWTAALPKRMHAAVRSRSTEGGSRIESVYMAIVWAIALVAGKYAILRPLGRA